MKEPLVPGIWKFSESKNRQFQVLKIFRIKELSSQGCNLIFYTKIK